MGLAEMQKILAQLYTDFSFREKFFAKSIDFWVAEGMDWEQVNRLKQLSAAEVAFFSRSLVRKHYKEASTWIPHTNKALGILGFGLFSRYLRQSDHRTSKTPKEHAKGFLNYIKKSDSIKSKIQPWIMDIMCYERCQLEKPIVRIFKLKYPIHEIMYSPNQNEFLSRIEPEIILAFYFRMPWGRIPCGIPIWIFTLCKEKDIASIKSYFGFLSKFRFLKTRV